MAKDRYERKHRRTAAHPECIRTMAEADFDRVESLSAAMGLQEGTMAGHILCEYKGEQGHKTTEVKSYGFDNHPFITQVDKRLLSAPATLAGIIRNLVHGGQWAFHTDTDHVFDNAGCGFTEKEALEILKQKPRLTVCPLGVYN